MANPRTVSLFQSATQRARVVKQGEIFCMIVDGGGAMIGFMQDYQMAQKWAQAKPASGNAITDRGRFMEQIPVIISRPGSFFSTRGSDKLVEKLAKAMKAAGYDVSEWMLPPELKDMGRPKKEPPKPKKGAEGEAEGEGAADPQDKPD